MAKQKIHIALDRLNAILPLAKTQSLLPEALGELHQNILFSFINHSSLSHFDPSMLLALEESKLILLDANKNISGAYPFSAQKKEHKVLINNKLVHAMCALDALSIAPMFNINTQISSVCRVTQEAIDLRLNNHTVLPNSPSKHTFFGIIWSSANNSMSCSDSLCLDMIFLRDQQVANDWLSESTQSREIFNLEEAILFASMFFKPLIEQNK